MEATPPELKIQISNLDFFYDSSQALFDISLDVIPKEITAFIGPSGCGKSTLLRCLNRMNDEIAKTRVEGEILLDGEDIYAPDVDVVELRRRVGLVFQKPNPFPQSVYNNVAMGPRSLNLESGSALEDLIEKLAEGSRSVERDQWGRVATGAWALVGAAATLVYRADVGRQAGSHPDG